MVSELTEGCNDRQPDAQFRIFQGLDERCDCACVTGSSEFLSTMNADARPGVL